MQERPIKAHGDLASEEVRHSDCRYRRLFETTQDGLLLLETASGLVSDVNPYLVDLLGYAHGEWVEELFWEAGPFAHSTDSKAMFADMQTADFVRYEDVTLRTKAGARIDVEFVSNSYDCEGIKVIQCNIRDISDRKAREAKFQRLTHLYAALSQTNHAIVHCCDEDDLFLQICQAAVKFGGMKMAWVGLVETDTLRVRPVASVGKDTTYLNDIHVTIDANSSFGRGPTGTAIRERRPQWCQDLLNNPLSSPWHEHIVRHGLAASASLPLSRNGMVIGALTLYAGETGAFDEAARRLLVEMATDISFALDVLAREVQRKNVEEEIASKNAILETQQETSLDAFLVVDENRRIISYNQQFVDLWKLPPEIVNAGQDAPVLTAVFRQTEDSEAFLARVEYLYNHSSEKSSEEIQLKDGRIIDRYSAPCTGTDGRNFGRVWYFRDITQRKQAEHEVRIAAIAFEAQEAIIVTDANKVILRVNRAFTELTGYSAEEAIGQTPASFLKSGRQDSEFYWKMWDTLARDHFWQGEIFNRRKNGDVHPDWLTITAVTNAEGEVTNYVSTYSDLFQLKEHEATIHALAFYDPLTNLPNRRLLLDRLQQTIAASTRHHQHGAVLFIDLDNFKTINDTRGHNVGDLLLIEVARRLQTCVRADDTVARLGGDEFVIILEELSEDPSQAAAQADAVCHKMLRAISEPYFLIDHEHRSSASIGVSLYRNREVKVDEILKRADAAMYQAKAAGRNTLRFYDPVMQTKLEARMALEGDLRLALAEGQLRLHYQPQFDHAGHIVGAEALIRWQHPQRGLLGPLEFIPLAEQTELILPVGQWVLDSACIQLKAWESDPHVHDLKLAVNVSARQFHKPDFVQQVLQTLENHAISHDRLELELTESLVLDDIDDTIIKMNELRQAGVHFSMDDFGTGYSSLAYLSRLPFNQLKIDQSFVRNIGVKHSDTVIVQTIIGMAHNMGIEAVAEGVETEVQRAFLELHGCMLYQGYLFGRPLPIGDFEARLKRM